jgi:GT2 family glycosyltransferase
MLSLRGMHDLAIVLVSYNAAHWLTPCLNSIFDHAGEISLDVVVACNSDDGSIELVEENFPAARVVRCENRGFAHANNCALVTCDARYVLFLNTDTEVRAGTFEQLVRALDERPTVGLAGVTQVDPAEERLPTIRYFPNALRALGDSLGAERLPFLRSWLGERELRAERYSREGDCDWTSGSFMIVRREALHGAGFMDERFFLYSEEPDLCLRVREAGWKIRYLPFMTVVHHAGKAGLDVRLTAQDAFSRLQYARKHFSPVHRAAYATALGIGYGLRAALPGARRSELRRAARAALRVLVGVDGPPFRPPPPQAVSGPGEAGPA